MGSLEDGPGSDGKVHSADVAAVVSATAYNDALAALTLRAEHTLRPEPGFKILTRCLLIWNHFKELKGADSRPTHTLIVANSPEGVKYIIPLGSGSFKLFLAAMANKSQPWQMKTPTIRG